MRVLEIGGRLDFLHEPLGPEDGGELRPRDLHRDLAVVLQIVGEADVRHATFAQVAFDLVAVGEGGREPGGDLGHGAKMDRLWGFGEVLRGTCLYAPPGVYTQPRESPMTSRYQPA